MLGIGPLFFAAPWVLLGLGLLPLLWWLMRVTPPQPRAVRFPPVRLLAQLVPREETPARTPPWLLILRLILAALLILAFARPLLNPADRLLGDGPLLLVIDDGWAAAADWQARRTVISRLLDQAERENRPVAVLATAAAPDAPVRLSKLMGPGEARRLTGAMMPKPWPTDRRAAAEALTGFDPNGSAHVAWLSDGLGDAHANRLAARLRALGPVRLYMGSDIGSRGGAPILLRAPAVEATALVGRVARAKDVAKAELEITALTENGRILGRVRASFGPGERTAEAPFDLPGELRNKVARLAIEGIDGAGAVYLLDERWRRRPVGLVAGDRSESAQPLLGELFYLERALAPFAEIRTGAVTELLRRDLAVLVMADIGKLADAEETRLTEWVENGGVIVRFAGARLAQADTDLSPVPLRGGGRALGGVMSWSQPARLAPFEKSSPFFGLTAPPDVTVRRQVLAEPSADLNAKSWARLTDGTPLVTGARRGKGWVVLVHTTANSAWSDLPFSGLFVEMMRRIIALSQGIVPANRTGGATGGAAGAAGEAASAPFLTLDGMGRLGAPPNGARPIPPGGFATAKLGPAHPPGYYGTADARRALNLADGLDRLVPLGTTGALGEFETQPYGGGAEIPFKPWLLLAAFLIALIDLGAGLALRGLTPRLPFRRRRAAGALGLLAGLALGTGLGAGLGISAAVAQDSDQFLLEATATTRLAYVRTGIAELDDVSSAGLTGLSNILRQRTAVEPGPPLGIDLARHELAPFPLLYWPISARQPTIDAEALARVTHYLRHGGTILFDTRSQNALAPGGPGQGGFGGSPAEQRLRALLERLDIPPLVPTPPDHVLTKSFYLLSEFPGRWTGGVVWVEQHGDGQKDGVSSIIIGAHDWAAAWAVDDTGRPRFAVVPGGERQREFAYRFGVNWVMYALTGNYKADQVHVPAIMRRLGQ